MEDKVIYINISKEAVAQREHMRLMPDKSMLEEDNYEAIRQVILAAEPKPFPEANVKNKLEKDCTCDGFDVYSLSNGDYDKIIYYIHGGAWVFDILQAHVEFCDDLCERLNAKVYMPVYPLAPKYSYKETYRMIMDFYDELLKQGKPIYVMGDSAGGTLTVGLVQRLIAQGKKLPEKIVPLSPAADLTFSNPEAKEVEARDPMLALYGVTDMAHMWGKETDLNDPALTPINGNLNGFPPTLLFISTDDILCPDDLILYEKLKAAGCDITAVVGQGLWHVFAICDTPERGKSLDIIADFCRN